MILQTGMGSSVELGGETCCRKCVRVLMVGRMLERGVGGEREPEGSTRWIMRGSCSLRRGVGVLERGPKLSREVVRALKGVSVEGRRDAGCSSRGWRVEEDSGLKRRKGGIGSSDWW